jgi:hypothetical protein
VHHTRKNVDLKKPLELTDIAWSGFPEFARQWVLVSPRETYVPGTTCHKLWMSVGGSAGHSSRWAVDVEQGRWDDAHGRRWEVTVSEPEEAKAAAAAERSLRVVADRTKRLADAKAKALLVLAEHPDGLTKSALIGQGVGKSTIDAVIQALLDQGLIEEAGVVTGNHRTPKPGYRLRLAA